MSSQTLHSHGYAPQADGARVDRVCSQCGRHVLKTRGHTAFCVDAGAFYDVYGHDHGAYVYHGHGFYKHLNNPKR